MQKIELKPEYDVIIIGSGIGGLTTAALLRKSGLSVCVLEMASVAGGYLSGFRRKNFRFDTAIHWLNQCYKGGIVFKIFDVLGTDYPKPIPQQKIRRLFSEQYNYLLTNNPDALNNQWIQEFPEDKLGIEKFFRAAKRLGAAFYNYGGFLRTEESMTFLEKIKNKKKLLKFIIPFIPHVRYKGKKGIQKGLDNYFSNPKLKAIFGNNSELLGCLIPIGWAYYGDFQSPPIGGSQRFTEWLEHQLNERETSVILKSKVKSIIVENGESKGVIFEHQGESFKALSKIVIAACDIETVFEKMLPPTTVPSKLLRNLKNAELYTSSVTLNIALNCSPADLGFGEEMVQLACKETSQNWNKIGDPESSEILILAPSLRDSTLAPIGQGTLTIFMPANLNFENNWNTETDQNGNLIRGEAYKSLKQEIAEKILDRVEKTYAPNLRNHIIFLDIATPVTHWRYTGNRGGTMMGAKPGKINMQNKIARYKTPIKNLLMSGHWAELGGGVPIAVKAGANAALLALKTLNPPAFNLLANYMDDKITIEDFVKSKLFLSNPNNWKPNPTPSEKQEDTRLNMP